MISTEDFVKQWMAAHRDQISISELGRRLGQQVQTVSNRSKYLKNKGVRLPELADAVRLDVDGMNKLIDDFK